MDILYRKYWKLNIRKFWKVLEKNYSFFKMKRIRSILEFFFKKKYLSKKIVN